MYTLRQAKASDIDFLFNVSTVAMLPVRKRNNPKLKLNLDKEFQEYKAEYKPEKIQVIQHKGQDVGRLRVVRSNKEIYVGGIQILPDYQRKGIGKAIFQDLIQEAQEKQVPIKLKVSKYNPVALNFYKNLGFISIEEVESDFLLRYTN